MKTNKCVRIALKRRLLLSANFATHNEQSFCKIVADCLLSMHLRVVDFWGWISAVAGEK